MLSTEDALDRIKLEYQDPDGYDFVRVELQGYERAQKCVMFSEPRQPRVYDPETGDMTRVAQITAPMGRFSDPQVLPGRITTFHHGESPGTPGTVLWSHYSDV